MQNKCGKVIEKGRNKKKKTKRLIYQWKSTMARLSCIAWESGQCELYFSLYTYESGLCFAVNDSRCGGFLTFSDTSWGPFSVAPSVSHDQRLPVNLSRSFSRSIDRSHRIDHLFSFFFSFARSLRFFNWLFSTSLSLALFYLFTRSFSRAEALYGTTGDLRETRPYFEIVFRFVLLLCFWLLSFPW